MINTIIFDLDGFFKPILIESGGFSCGLSCRTLFSLSQDIAAPKPPRRFRVTLFTCYCSQTQQPLFPFMLGNNLLLDILGNLLVFLKEHRVVSAALGLGTKIGGITEHLC